MSAHEVLTGHLMAEDVRVRFHAAKAFAEARAYRGYDAYDGLASPALRRLPGTLGKRVATQAIKRYPPDFAGYVAYILVP